MKRILRAFLAVKPGEETEAKEHFYHVYGSLPQWEEPHMTMRSLIEATYLKYGVPTPKTLENDIKDLNREDVEELLREVMALDMPTVSELTQAVIQTTQDVLTESWKIVGREQAQILLTGKNIGKVKKQGLVEAIRHTLAGAMKILSQFTPDQRTSTLQQDMASFRSEYLKVRDNPQAGYGLPWGIKPLDEATNGIFRGEFAVIAAGPGDGKTTSLMNVIYNHVIVSGFNGFMWSGEMRKTQILRILACIHSMAMDWGDAPKLDYDKIKKGHLTPEEEDFLLNTLIPDLERNPKYGKLYIEPSDTMYPNMDLLRTKAEVINQLDPLDAMYIDYDALLHGSPGDKSSDRKGELNSVIMSMKQTAKSFAQGRMIAVMTCHQINRKGKEEADKSEGVYKGFSCLSDANEIERSADHIVATWSSEAALQKKEARWSHLKNRDGKLQSPFFVYVDKERRYVGNLASEDASADASLMDV